MDLHIDDNPTLTTSISPPISPNFLQKSNSLTMNDPKPQLSPSIDRNLKNPYAYNQSRSRLSQTNGICSNSSSDHEFVQFRPNPHHQDSDESGVCSPPLWKNSPSPPRSPSHPLLRGHRNLSPDSRLRAITRGQRELMEIVKTMPESSYELSLKDLVEHHNIETQIAQSDGQNLQQRGAVKVKRQESRKNEKNLVRIESFESKGLFLNMVFPFSFKSKKKRNFASSSSGKVSPAVKGGGERDWWKKKFTGSSDSDSSRTSNNSGSTVSGGSSSGRIDGGSGGRKTEGFIRGCWLFFRWRNNKCVE